MRRGPKLGPRPRAVDLCDCGFPKGDHTELCAWIRAMEAWDQHAEALADEPEEDGDGP